jgi:hypothetical protein
MCECLSVSQNGLSVCVSTGAKANNFLLVLSAAFNDLSAEDIHLFMQPQLVTLEGLTLLFLGVYNALAF